MENEKKNEIQKAQGNSPAILGAGAGTIEGMEETDAEDIRIPRIKLLQGSSEEIKNPEEYPDLRVGLLINSLSKEELISVKKENRKLYPFIPVKMFKSWIKFNPYNDDAEGFDPTIEPGALVFKTYDRNDPLTKTEDAWRYKQINFLGFQPDDPKTPIFVAFGSMSRPTGQSIINTVQLAGRPLFEHMFLLGSKTETKNGNTFMVFTAKSEGKPEDVLCQTGRQLYNEFNPLLADMKKMSVKLHDEDGSVDQPSDVKWDE